eukprot:COSAG05_NODE_12523_length_464_cov_1.271233_1_plen_31_part_01
MQRTSALFGQQRPASVHRFDQLITSVVAVAI